MTLWGEGPVPVRPPLKYAPGIYPSIMIDSLAEIIKDCNNAMLRMIGIKPVEVKKKKKKRERIVRNSLQNMPLEIGKGLCLKFMNL